ncbi:MAG: hypothetical protein AAFV86_11660 [Pseudomonadota bacterium]
METTLYTIHTLGGREDRLRIIGDARHALAILPPVWAVWRGLWITAILMVAAIIAAAVFAPLATSTVYVAILILVFLEGSTIERAELRLRGWEEVGIAEARSEEGAEEQYRQGRAVLPARYA